MPGKYGFDFNGASQSFNILAEYLFGKVDMVSMRGFENELMLFVASYVVLYCLLIYHTSQNTMKESMEMTTPVFTRKTQSDGERMEMTIPVITRKVLFFLPPVSKCKFSEKCKTMFCSK